MVIQMTVDGAVIATATLDNNESAMDFVALLPLTLTLKDYEATEKIADLPTGEYPEGIASAADGASVYVANWFDNSLVRIDVASLKVIAEARTGDGPRAFGQFIARVPTR